MASKAMHLRMAKKGRPVHCADGKWRTRRMADYFLWGLRECQSTRNGTSEMVKRKGWEYNKKLRCSAQARKSYIEGFIAREKTRKV
jgi:hypothetical protein